MLSILPNSLRVLLALFLWNEEPKGVAPASPQNHQFQLRHLHSVYNARNVFSDVSPSFAAISHVVSTRNIATHRPSSAVAFSDARRGAVPLAWKEEQTIGPDIEKREALLQLAKMSFDSYYDGPSDSQEWYDLGPEWNTSYPHGWEPDADGLRGQIFVSTDNSTVVISIKGASTYWSGDGPSKPKDKLNTNLLFSCCCARVGPSWSPVCGCYSGSYRCDETCLQEALTEDDLFYSIGINLYNNVSYMYPDANIWLTGHSMGGALASLVGITFGAPVVSFESPGDKMAAARLHLPTPPSTHHITHLYHTADPIPMGVCTGVFSSCAIGGYAIESRCHLGKVIRYDTAEDKGWRVVIRNHGIQVVIDYLLNEDWKPKKGFQVPPAEVETDCEDCMDWKFGDYQNRTLLDY